MSNDDPFTLDLFGNTALSSGLGLGITAFPSSLEVGGDDDPSPSSPAPARAVTAAGRSPAPLKGENFYLGDHRGLATSWRERARDNLAAICLASEIEQAQRPATTKEQAALIKFIGFGASDLANGVFRRPGETDFRKGWEEIGADLEDAVATGEYASLARCTQYAHFTPEFIVRAIWAGLQRLGWRGGRVLEPGIGTGLFPALIPEELRTASHVTGIELDRSWSQQHSPARRCGRTASAAASCSSRKMPSATGPRPTCLRSSGTRPQKRLAKTHSRLRP